MSYKSIECPNLYEYRCIHAYVCMYGICVVCEALIRTQLHPKATPCVGYFNPTSYLFSRKHRVIAGNFRRIQFSRIGDLYLFVGFISLTSAIMPIMHCTVIVHGLIAKTSKS